MTVLVKQPVTLNSRSIRLVIERRDPSMANLPPPMRETPPDRINYYINETTLKVFHDNFEEFRSAIERRSFDDLARFVAPFLVQTAEEAILQTPDFFRYASFPLSIVILLVKPSFGTNFIQSNSKKSNCIISVDFLLLIICYLIERYQSDKQKRNLLQRIFHETQSLRDLPGRRNQNLQEAMVHEFNHFVHFCANPRVFREETWWDRNPYSLQLEAVTMLYDFRETPFIVYPRRDKFEATSHTSRSSGQWHPHAFFMGYFIGLARMKKHHQSEFEQLSVQRREKGKWVKIGMKWVNFADILQDENRPFYLQNLPPATTDQIIADIRQMSFRKYLRTYYQAARTLGIPEQQLLVRKDPLLRRFRRTRETAKKPLSQFRFSS